MNYFEWFVALRYLRSRRKEVFISIITIISILGVAISVMVLNIVLAVMTGFEDQLQKKLLDTSAHIVVTKYIGDFTEWRQVAKEIEQVSGVVSVTPYTYSQAMVSGPGGAFGLLIRGIANDNSQREKLEKSFQQPGSWERIFEPWKLEFQRPDGTSDIVELPPLLIGRSLSRKLGLGVGEPVTLLSPQLSASPQGLIPRLKRFAVAGTYATGLVEYESGMAYTSIEAAQSFFGMGESISGLEVMVTDMESAIPLARKIEAELANSGSQLQVTDWTVPNKPLWEALQLEKRVYFIVLLLLILVASFSIVSTLVMMVMEKTKDIAILKSLGLSDERAMRIFLLQGTLIGLVGTLLGTLLGYLGCLALREYGFPLDEAVFSLSAVPVYMEPANFFVVALAAFVITSLAGRYPARRAARLRPADALRFE